MVVVEEEEEEEEEEEDGVEQITGVGDEEVAVGTAVGRERR